MNKRTRYKIRLIFATLCLFQITFGQVGKDGAFSTSTAIYVPNAYTYLTSNASVGNTAVTVYTETPFSVGDLILIIQMQGASVNCYINGGNPASSLPNGYNYGAITNYNNAGNQEFAEILSISGKTLTLTCALTKNYTVSGKTQVIRVPRYTNLTVNSGHQMMGAAWDGTVGGVVAIEVSGTLTINNNGKITADTIGFRGGKTNFKSTSSFGTSDWGYLNSNAGVYKGESIAGDTTVYTTFAGRFCKGAIANGGGGGNSVNAGGGGGANGGDTSLWNGRGNPDVSVPAWITAWNLESPGFATNTSSGGGRGGYTFSNSNKDPITYAPNDYTNWGGDGRRPEGGIGGRPLDYNTGRIFMGGGGGGGDEDNNYGGVGGNGGGIVYILNYGVIIGGGSNAIISANGHDGHITLAPSPPINNLTGRDGAGGGGGGGCVIIRTTSSVSGTISVSANGGKGGDQYNRSGPFASPADAYGPGGGGGGGYIGSNVILSNTSVIGGVNGIVTYSGTPNSCTIDNNFPPNGATKGGSGSVTNSLSIPNTISVNPSTLNICAGSAISATAIPTNTTSIINWYSSLSSTTSISTGSVISLASYTVPGTYTVYAGICPGFVRVPITLTVNASPTITVNSPTICSGQTATLTAGGASSFTWNIGSNSTSITVTPTITTNYTITGSNGTCSSSKTTAVNVIANPTITVNSATICSGQTATLTASGASSFTWNTGSNSNSITVTPTLNTTYTVTGANGSCSSSQTTAVSITTNPTITVNSATICSGQTATLTAGGASSFTWNTGSNSTSITVTPSITTSYTITGANGTCSSSKTPTVTVNTTPTVSVNSPTICSGQTATLIASGASSFTWNTSSNASSITVNPITSTSYTVTGGNGVCTSFTTTTISVNATPTISVGSYTICTGQSLTLTAIGALSYTWNTGATTGSIVVTPTSNTTYTVTGDNLNGCASSATSAVAVGSSISLTINSPTICTGSTAILTPTSTATNYTWLPGNTNTSTLSVSPTTTTTYTLLGSNGTCSGSSTTQVLVNANPTLSISGNTVICSGSVITLTASGASTYTWQPNGITTSGIFTDTPSSSVNYTILGTDNNNCSAFTIYSLQVTPLPTITVNSPTICGGIATLTVSGASTYTWLPSNTTGSTYTTQPSITTTYTVIGENSNCVSSQTAIVTVNSAPSLVLTSDSYTICPHNCVNLSVAPSTYTNILYDYGDGNGGVPINNICYNSSGTHTIIAQGTYTNGCINTSTVITIFVQTAPTASFSFSNGGGNFVNQPIGILNNSSNSSLYSWNFGDGNSLATYSLNINHTYSSSGNYCVKLTAIDTTYLCTDTVTHCILIEDNFSIQIPNIFTPNADGTNDVFIITAKGVKTFEGTIFDRWGLVLYNWTDIKTGWNGYMSNNAKAPTGTYYYLVKCTLINGEAKEYKGYFTLLD